jgi:leucyl aminopeptidase
MKSKLIDNYMNLNSVYDIIVFCFTLEQWNVLISEPQKSKYSHLIDVSKVIDFKGDINTFEFNKCYKLDSNQKVLLYSIEPEKNGVYRFNKRFYQIKSFRKNIYNLTKLLIENKSNNVLLHIDLIHISQNFIIKQYIDNLCMIVRLTNYNFDKYITLNKKHKIKVFDLFIECILDKQDLYDTFHKSKVMSKYTNYARNLINERANICNPDYLEEKCVEISKKYNLPIKIIKGDELLKENMNLFYSVGVGSMYLPRLIIFEFLNGNNDGIIDIALIGKGITFDTGGYNLKPKGSIEDMYIDMSGSAVVLSVLLGLIELNIKKNIIVALPIAENMIDGKAYRPSDILISRKGLSVEIGNTDAEGRLLIADTMTYIQDMYKINSIIDIATLTGGIVTALGESIAGIFGNYEANDMIKELIKAGNYKYERCWHLPILDEHIESLKGKESDINSMGNFNGAQALVASAFLSQFINDDIEWVHIDIAGPSSLKYINNWQYKSGTGFGVGLLLQYLIEN